MTDILTIARESGAEIRQHGDDCYSATFGEVSLPAYTERIRAERWQPIETAPKDGTWYLATDGADRWTQNQPSDHHYPGEWHWEANKDRWSGHTNLKEATHWQLLPPPLAAIREA